jgi:hypothetical protein
VISLLAFNKGISQDGLSTILETQFMPLNQATQNISKIPHSKIKKWIFKIRYACHQKEKESNPNEKDNPTRSSFISKNESQTWEKPNHISDPRKFRQRVFNHSKNVFI